MEGWGTSLIMQTYKSSEQDVDVEQAWLKYLDSTPADELVDRIARFDRVNIRDLSWYDVRKELAKVYGDEWVLPVRTQWLYKGTRLYRARRMDKTWNDTESDCWCPPRDVVQRGRMNKLGEPRLYVASDPQLAEKEIKVETGTEYALIEYEVSATTELRSGPDPLKETAAEWAGGRLRVKLSRIQLAKVKLLLLFGRRWMTREILPEEAKYLYMVTGEISDRYCPCIGSGWIYGPANRAKTHEYNVCFLPKSNDGPDGRSIADLLHITGLRRQTRGGSQHRMGYLVDGRIRWAEK